MRRLLLITMAFPPDDRIGSLRWQKLAPYVAERGWQLDVVTLDPSSVPSVDPSRLAELPAGTRAYGVPMHASAIDRVVQAAWKAYQRLRAHRMPRAATTDSPATTPSAFRPASVRSAEVHWDWRTPRQLVRAYYAYREHADFGRWASDAARLALRLIEPGVHEGVITSGPPHMAHVAGLRVSRATGLPLIIDLRDPWSIVQRVPEHAASPLWLWLADRDERETVAQAAVIVANTDACRVAMCRRYPEVTERIITVTNGCDTDPLPPSGHDHRFMIGYAGGIYFDDHDPRPLFRAAARLIEEFALEPADFGIEFVGSVERYGSKPVSEIAREEGIERFVALSPKRPRREVLEFLARATMLVLLHQDSDLTIPAKVFEYVRFDAWVLALTTHHGALGVLLRGTGADIVPRDDFEGLVRVLRNRFVQFRGGVRPRRIARDDRFSRRGQAQRLLDAISLCTNGQRAAPALRPRRPA